MAQPAQPKSMKERLMELQLLKNEARGRLRKATEEEIANEKAGPRALAKKEKEEDEKKTEQFKQKLQEEGIDPERHQRLHQTLETQELQEKHKKRKYHNAHEVDVFGQDGQYRAFKRQRNQTEFDKEAYERQKEEKGDEFYNPAGSLEYGGNIHDDPNKVTEMVEALKAQQEKNAKFSRRRTFDESQDITFINERNRKFNLKINRAFDKYTEEIRENLERGTAL